MNAIGKVINGQFEEFANNGSSGGDISQKSITFEQATTLANVQSGDSISVALGKLSKLYAELEGKAAFYPVSESREIAELGTLMDGKTAVDWMNEISDKTVNNCWNFKDFIQILIGTNLDTCKDVGNYCCYSNSDAATLVNCPVNVAFTMRVEYANGRNNYLRQIISTYFDSETYVRNHRNDENGEIWSTWESFIKTNKILTSTDDSAYLNDTFLMSGKKVADSITSFNKMKYVKILFDYSVDLNDLNETAVYLLTKASTNPNKPPLPTNVSGFLHVYNTGETNPSYNLTEQIVYSWDGHHTYHRTKDGDGWGKWKTYCSQTASLFPSSGVNLNNYIYAGVYFAGSYHEGVDLNFPENAPGWLEVIDFNGASGTDFCLQKFYVWNSVRIYTRSRNQNGWSPWKQVGDMAGLCESELLQVNSSLIGNNNVRICRSNRLRIINGYVSITKTIKSGDILVYLGEYDKPMNTQWCPSICFGNPATSRNTMNLTISTNGTDIHINDDLPLSTGTYGIFFVYYI